MTMFSHICNGARPKPSFTLGSAPIARALPFTAHVNIPNEYRQRYNFKEENEHVESSIRLWATNLALSFLKEAEQRNRDSYFRFYMNFINFLGQHGLEETYKNFPKCSNLIYLDTAVSGLASHTILKGFQSAGYKPYMILVVNSYGAKLKPSYTWILRRLEAEGYARKILVSKLIAEDTNSALLGVGATIYPTILMAKEQDKTNWSRELASSIRKTPGSLHVAPRIYKKKPPKRGPNH
jgi:hypothetical protein